MKFFQFAGVSSSAKIALTGQTGSQAPQSMLYIHPDECIDSSLVLYVDAGLSDDIRHSGLPVNRTMCPVDDRRRAPKPP